MQIKNKSQLFFIFILYIFYIYWFIHSISIDLIHYFYFIPLFRSIDKKYEM